MFPLLVYNTLEKVKVRDSSRWDHQLQMAGIKTAVFLFYKSSA